MKCVKDLVTEMAKHRVHQFEALVTYTKHQQVPSWPIRE